ncbi:Myb-like transcription factor family protein [Quillaja saponaria]|uniref:Myb-like transcription factor family protein n=1 Tax=Quillaja saponaria TaxID=32244 RepID=A0AAD7PES2_QUISA|nr:Myb-like transcription factor family protein [Quillaja saponaria]
MELSLDLSLAFVPKTISEFLGEVSKIRDVSERMSKLDDFVKRLEDEMRKIDAFKRELPLCMLLIYDAILRLKEEIVQCTKMHDLPVIEEFMPLKKNSREDYGLYMGEDCSDKKNWMSSAQLWSTNNKLRSEEDDGSVPENPNQPWNQKNNGGAFLPFRGNSGFSKMVMKEDKEVSQVPSLSLMTPVSESKSSSRGSSGSSLLTDPIKVQGQQQQQQLQQTSRKQRRCWSPELHRRFVDSLQKLGGAQVATPKQIRDLMQVEGLTNDEVKSHLQKYRLHVRRLPASTVVPSNGLWMTQDQCGDRSNPPQSGSPQGPFLVEGSAKGHSSSGGTSMDAEEDEKSDGHSWRGGLPQLEVNV